jgi:hypothetical protein
MALVYFSHRSIAAAPVFPFRTQEELSTVIQAVTDEVNEDLDYAEKSIIEQSRFEVDRARGEIRCVQLCRAKPKQAKWP